MTEKNEFLKTLSETIPWAAKEQKLWPTTSFILRRNLARYMFPNKLQKNEALQVMEMIKQAVLENPAFKSTAFLKNEELSPTQRELLTEHFLYLQSFQEGPNGSAFLIDSSTFLLARLNENNHLELHLIDPNSQLDASWDFLSKIDTAIGSRLEWAFSSRFGYLTADPSLCGTGLSMYAHLHVPALIHSQKLEEMLSKNEEEIEASSLSGKLDDLIGNLIILKNRYTVGISEDRIIHSVESAANKLASAEKSLRQNLKDKNNVAMKDLISKTFGLLVHAYQLDAKELLNFLSLMKLGLDLGWVSGASDQKLSELMFKCRRGHFSQLFPDLSAQDLSHQRAAYLHEALKEIQLTI